MGKALEKFAGVPKAMKFLAKKVEKHTGKSQKASLLGGKNNAVVRATAKSDPSGSLKRTATSNQLRESYLLNRVAASKGGIAGQRAARTAREDLNYAPAVHDFHSPLHSKITKRI